MRILLQRVSSASVSVSDQTIAQIGKGLLLLVGFRAGDSTAPLDKAIDKVTNLRIFTNESGRFDLSVRDISGGILAVPQFTLYGDTSKGRRPDFFSALEPEKASDLFDEFVVRLLASGIQPVQKGSFGAHMQVELVNDGPVTMMLEF